MRRAPEAVRTRHALPGPGGRTATPKGPGATVPAAGPGARAPTWSGGTPAANRPGEQVGGRYHLYPHLGGDRVPGDRPRLLHEESSRVRDWGDSTRHQSWSARRSTWRPAGARRGEGRRSSTPRPRQPVHLHPARRPPERLRHSSFGGQDRGVLGGCLGGSRRMRPSRNERVYQMVYPTRSKAIRDIASWIELEHTIRNDSTPPWGTGRPTRSRRSTEQ